MDDKKTLERRSVGIDRRPAPETSAEIIHRAAGPPAHPLAPREAGTDLGEFEAIFHFAPIAMILVDRDRTVLRMNRAAAQFAGRPGAELVGQMTGLALCCANEPEAPDGCGTGRACAQCPFRQLIERSFDTRKNVHQVETSAPFAEAGQVRQRQLRISTAFMRIHDQDRTLICLQDRADLALPEGTLLPYLKEPSK